MKIVRLIYPSLVGGLLGLLQTGLFFQLAFTLSSGVRTFLMITVCWLLGSAIGLRLAKRVTWSLNIVLVTALLAYFGCVALLGLAPFNTDIWPLYALLIVLMGVYPGVFFVRLGDHYTVRTLFFRENNGFILGLVSGTLFFLILGRFALWTLPLLVGGIVILCTIALFRPQDVEHDGILFKPLKEINL